MLIETTSSLDNTLNLKSIPHLGYSVHRWPWFGHLCCRTSCYTELFCRISCISSKDETDFLPLKRLISIRWRRCRRSKPEFFIWCPSWESIYHSFRLLGRFFKFPVSGYSTFYSINDLPGWPLKDGMAVFFIGACTSLHGVHIIAGAPIIEEQR